jgi:hypothetical protein
MNTILKNNDLGCENDTFSERSQPILIKGRFKFEKIVSMNIVFQEEIELPGVPKKSTPV